MTSTELNLKFQERIDQALAKDFHPSFLETESIDECNQEDRVLNQSMGVFGSGPNVGTKTGYQLRQTFSELVGHPQTATCTTPSVHSIFGFREAFTPFQYRIIWYIYENWHKAVQLIQTNVAQVRDQTEQAMLELDSKYQSSMSRQNQSIEHLRNRANDHHGLLEARLQSAEKSLDELANVVDRLNDEIRTQAIVIKHQQKRMEQLHTEHAEHECKISHQISNQTCQREYVTAKVDSLTQHLNYQKTTLMEQATTINILQRQNMVSAHHVKQCFNIQVIHTLFLITIFLIRAYHHAC